MQRPGGGKLTRLKIDNEASEVETGQVQTRPESREAGADATSTLVSTGIYCALTRVLGADSGEGGSIGLWSRSSHSSLASPSVPCLLSLSLLLSCGRPGMDLSLLERTEQSTA